MSHLEEAKDDGQLGLELVMANMRRSQARAFDDWVREKLPDMPERLLQHAGLENRKSSSPTSMDPHDHTRPMQSLICDSEQTQIINTPRDYQLELFERAKTQNLIAVLDTGSGKTLIAILLLRWTVDQELERRTAGHPRKVAFFLVTSVNLAMQQHAVLGTNLPHDIKLLYGDLNVDAWTTTEWRDTLDNHQIVVCTAEVLNQALGRGYVAIQEINLLIFDEAHHTKKDHPYARIIKDFYMQERDVSLRPRIFGMTASPVDAKTDVSNAARTLELLLESQIITTGKLSSLQSLRRPEELVLHYPPHERLYNSHLVQELQSRFGHLVQLQKVITRARHIAAHLGEWCADQYLLGLTSLHRKLALENEVRNSSSTTQFREDGSDLEDVIKQYSVLFDYLHDTPLRQQDISDTNISGKISMLASQLDKHFGKSENYRCLVFVEERFTSYLLSLLFQSLGIANLRCSFLTGSGEAFSDTARCTTRDQALTMLKFSKGELNCLFATSVAEEGLDIPECNLVIRFDMCKSMIQYIQSRGRARQAKSRFIHMNEAGNSIHEQMTIAVRQQEYQMRQYCQQLPVDRQLLGDVDDDLVTGVSGRFHVEPETGARLTEHNALVFLNNYVSRIPTDIDEPQRPVYYTTAVGAHYKTEVVLPAGAPVASIVGGLCAKRSLAHRWAAFDACLELRRLGHLNAHYKPSHTKKTRVKQARILADGLNKQEKYDMQMKPRIWKQSRGTFPAQLWLTVFDFDDGSNALHTPIALLTRTRMPSIPSIPLFWHDGCLMQVRSVSVTKPLVLLMKEVSRLCEFTLRIFHDVFSKSYENTAEHLSYFLAPASRTGVTGEPNIDWTVVNTVCTNQNHKWQDGDATDDLLGKLLLDPLDGSRKFVIQSVNTTLKATDPLPDDSIKSKFSQTILDASYSMKHKCRNMSTFTTSQPVLNAELLCLRRNMLIPPSEREKAARTKAYICPEPLEISLLPVAFAVSCLAWPSIVWRLESVLITQEACDRLALPCDTKLALAAFTKDADEVVEHGNVELVNFRQGMGENYERLEFLGDTFLKMTTTISVFIQGQEENEENLHIRRMLMLCNRNLFDVASELELYKYIRTLAFHRRFWYPEGLNLVKGKGAGTSVDNPDIYEQQTHPLSVKTIADVAEALIGATYLTHDDPITWTAENWTVPLQAVTTLVQSEDHRMQCWSDYAIAYKIPACYLRLPNASERNMAEQARGMHEYSFKSPTILRSAFLHPSQPRELEQLPSYQTLEFLGDALLDMAIISYIFRSFPSQDPHWLTETKGLMVSNRFLGALACTLGFHRLLRHNSAVLQAQITTYAIELDHARQSTGHARDYWIHVSEPPKCLADIVESYVGAMFLDSGFDFGQVLRFFDEHMKWFFVDMSIYAEHVHGNYTTQLTQFVQQKYGCQGLRAMTKEIPTLQRADRRQVVVAVMIHNQVITHSTGASSKYAGARAAKEALSVLKDIGREDFRTSYSCDCGH